MFHSFLTRTCQYYLSRNKVILQLVDTYYINEKG